MSEGRSQQQAVTQAMQDAQITGTGWIKITRSGDGEYGYEAVFPAKVMELETRWPNDCGGCAGIGSHKRWCRASVGDRAAMFGRASEQAEGLGDTIGANMPQAANAAYGLAGKLREAANDAALFHIAHNLFEEETGERFCACAEGPYIGTQPLGEPVRCERCRLLVMRQA